MTYLSWHLTPPWLMYEIVFESCKRVYFVWIFFLFFWLVLDSNLVNITDFMLWNVKDLILTESELLLLSTSCSSCISCMSGVLVLLASIPWKSSIPLWNGSAYHTHCTSYQMPDTVSVCMLQHSIYSFLF